MNKLILEKSLNEIKRKNLLINAITQLNPELDSIIRNLPQKNLILQNIPIAIKDNLATTTCKTNCASLILDNYHSPFNATAVEKLLIEGAILIGKTNLDEFGMGSFNVYSKHGPTINPHSTENNPRVAGGSSGGSAAAVAAGFCSIAIGSDTGGSVRLPAAYCGIVGFKPSYGRISRYGLIPYANSLDTIGIMSKTVAETETVFDIMKGVDENDPTSVKFVDLPKPITTENNLEGIKIGIPSEYYVEGISDEVLESWNLAIHHLESKGATIVPVSLPSTQFALSAYYIISPAEAYSNLAKYDGIRYGHRSDLKKIENTRAEGFGNEVKRRLMIGAFVLKSSTNVYYKKAQQMRAKVQRDFDETFISINPLTNFQPRNPKVNLLLTPASMTSAPTLEDVKLNKCNPYVNDVFTIPASLAGLPAIVVPCKRDAGELPIGLQLIGQYGDDSLVLKVAKSLESSS